MGFLKNTYGKLRVLYYKMKFFYSVNWTKTLFFNFKKFPFETAKKLPIFFYGKVKFKSIKGEIVINAPIKRGMIGFGQPYEIISQSKGISSIFIQGTVVFNGYVQLGKDFFVHVSNTAILTMGNMSSLGNNGKIICYEKICLGNYARLGFESQIIDTTAHQMINTKTGEKYPLTEPIELGSYNYISNRVTILSGTKTPDYCTIASNSLCNKNYVSIGKNTLIGGIPAKLLKTDISRDWVGELEKLQKNLIV